MDFSRENRRGTLFYVSAGVYTVIILTLVIFIPLIIQFGEFFVILNDSRYVEVASAFRKITLYLQGYCITSISGSLECFSYSFLEMFYKMPDYSKIPKKVSPNDIPLIFQNFPGQNPYVFIPMVISEIVACVCFFAAIKAMSKNSYKLSIMVTTGFTFLLVTILSVAMGISDKIYKDVLPTLLNNPITSQVTTTSGKTQMTGRLVDVGITFTTGNGRNMLIVALVLSIVAFFVGLRWTVEGKTRKLASGDNFIIRKS